MYPTAATVLPAKSDSGIMFCLQSYYGPIIDRSLAVLIYRFALAQVECTSECLTNSNCKENMTSLSLLVGTSVNTDRIHIFT